MRNGINEKVSRHMKIIKENAQGMDTFAMKQE